MTAAAKALPEVRKKLTPMQQQVLRLAVQARDKAIADLNARLNEGMAQINTAMNADIAPLRKELEVPDGTQLSYDKLHLDNEGEAFWLVAPANPVPPAVARRRSRPKKG